MIQIYYFSGAGHTWAAAEQLAEALNAPAMELPKGGTVETGVTVLVFPVYCQNVPPNVMRFLGCSSFEYLYPVAVYGGFCPGNVLRDVQKAAKGRVIGGAIFPSGHTFLGEAPLVLSENAVAAIRDRIRDPRPVRIPVLRKDPLSDLFPAWRSRVSVRLEKNDRCSGCGICAEHCPMGAIRNGITNRNCIRCLRCVTECPLGALEFRPGPILKHYLARKRQPKEYLF